MLKVRVKFSKEGAMKFIGHLDIMRYFQKAIRRANIPIAFSGGFSPHMIMSFAAPLGVGVTSAGEYFDMELTDDSLSSKEMENRLNATMAEGMKVISVGSRQKDEEVARHLFEALRKFDETNVTKIYSESFEKARIGAAIMNRLMKAAGNKLIKV